MAGSRKPGPQDACDGSVEIEDGTLCRSVSPEPGPIGITAQNSRDLQSLASAGQTEAALAAIRRETGCAVGESLKGQIPELIRILSDLRSTAAPWTALAGSPARRRIGGLRDALVALDLDFLPKSIDRGSGELIRALMMGDAQIVGNGRNTGVDSDSETTLPRGVGILVRIILQGVVERELAPLLIQLHSSKLGEAFATWIANNWTDLLKNPRLRWPHSEGAAFPAGERVVFQRKSPASPVSASTYASESPTFPDADMAVQAATLVAAAAQGAPFCPV